MGQRLKLIHVRDQIKNNSISKNPHKCFFCEGYGSKFINEHTNPKVSSHYKETEPCPICEGKGIVWG